ncbi:MAG TPA: hypothetical protein PKJ14_01320 [Candidatus Cloacimonadota bacterium]|nr:hypothetical protein [Candidatus Cloacimonadota bacterium]HQL15010.1 hypothetical protein [Candidatus Cloacimonadota bacterium]
MKNSKIILTLVLILAMCVCLNAQRSTNQDKTAKETSKDKVIIADNDEQALDADQLLDKIASSNKQTSHKSTNRAVRNYSSKPNSSREEKPSQNDNNRSSHSSGNANRSSSRQTETYKEDKPSTDYRQANKDNERYNPNSYYYKDRTSRSVPNDTYKTDSTQKPSSQFVMPSAARSSQSERSQSERSQSLRSQSESAERSSSQFILKTFSPDTDTKPEPAAAKPELKQKQQSQNSHVDHNSVTPVAVKPVSQVTRHVPNTPPPPAHNNEHHVEPPYNGHGPHHGNNDSDFHHHEGNDWHHDYNHHPEPYWHAHHAHHHLPHYYFYFDFSYHPYYSWYDGYYYWDDWTYGYYVSWFGPYGWNSYWVYYPYYEYYHHRHYRYVAPVFVYNFEWKDDGEDFSGYLVRKPPYSNLHNGNGWLNITEGQPPSDAVYCNIRGYSIVTKDENGKKVLYHFDSYGNRLAKELWKTYGKNGKKVYVQVKGVLNPETHTIKVYSMHKISKSHSSTVAVYWRWVWHPHHRHRY